MRISNATFRSIWWYIRKDASKTSTFGVCPSISGTKINFTHKWRNKMKFRLEIWHGRMNDFSYLAHLAGPRTICTSIKKREFFIDNLLVRIHVIIVMNGRTGLAPWEIEFPFPGSLTSTFLEYNRYIGSMTLVDGVQLFTCVFFERFAA